MRGTILVGVMLMGAIAGAGAPTATAGAQRARPRISPHETTTAVVDGNRMAVVYGRPSMRGRTIWGGLVRWGSIWTPGADEATLLTTKRALVIQGHTVPAGSYSLYMVVDEQHPQLVINRQTGQWHTVYTPSQDLVRVDLERASLDVPVEQLTIEISARPGGGGSLAIIWDRTRFAVSFTVGATG
jgi:hypothetical protein